MTLTYKSDPSIAHFAREAASSRLTTLGHPANLSARELMLWAPETASKVVVDEPVALNYSAVWAATSLLCSVAGMLPLCVWRPNSGKLKPDRKHPLSQLLTGRINPYMTAYDAKSLITRGQVNRGNGYAEIVRDGGGQVAALLPIRPHRVTPKILTAGMAELGFEAGDLVYEIAEDSDDRDIRAQRRDKQGRKVTYLGADEVLDIRSKLTHEGIVGMGVVAHAAETIGLGLRTEEFGAKYYGTNGMPRIIINVLSKMSADAQRDFRKQWQETYGENSDPSSVAVLPDGEAKIHVLDLNPNDADLLNTRKFTVEEVARWYGLPAHLLQQVINGSTDLEQQGVEFVNYSLMPWLHRQQEEFDTKLLSEEERAQGYCIRYDIDNLQKGDLQSRVSAYAKMLQYGFNMNEVREKENLPPLPDAIGETRFFPANMTTLDKVISGENLKSQQKEGSQTDGRNADGADPDDPSRENVAQAPGSGHSEELESAWLQSIQQRFDYKAEQAVQKLRQRHEPFARVEEFYQKHTAQHREEVGKIPGCRREINYQNTLARLKKDWPV